MKVSVVMPAYNAEKYIEAAVRSVLGQTWTDFELLIIDDCSQDATAEIAGSLAERDERIILLKNARNAGVSASRNTGVAWASGEWIAFLDSDDLWREDKLERQLEFIRHCPEAALTYTASAFINEEGYAYGYILEAEAEVTYETLLRRNLLSCSSVMVRRELMLRYPMGGDRMHEDYAVWLLILREIRCAYGLNEPLLIYRLRGDSKSGDRRRAAKMMFCSYRHVGYSGFSAGILTLRYAIYSILKRRRITGSALERG